jgi:HK97 family phage prohead protease
MQIEVRENSVVISGYVNAVERWSKPIKANLRGKVQQFIEKIKAGAFSTALKRNNDVKVLLNHNSERELANTQNGTAKLEEDNIGLRAEVTITDAEVMEKAKNHKLVGWSFGFYANADDVGDDGTMATRTVNDMDLIEVSILDDTKSPAYYGTSIETRSEGEKEVEYRALTIEEIEAEAKERHKAINEQEKNDWETIEAQHKAVDIEKDKQKFELFAEMVANKVLEKLKGEPRVETVEEKPKEEQPETEEKRAIDYSSFEERIAKLNHSPNNENCAK